MWLVKERGTGSKMKVVTLVERQGRARSVVVRDLTARTIREFLAPT